MATKVDERSDPQSIHEEATRLRAVARELVNRAIDAVERAAITLARVEARRASRPAPFA